MSVDALLSLGDMFMSVSLFQPAAEDFPADSSPAEANSTVPVVESLAPATTDPPADPVLLPTPTTAELRQLALQAIEQASLPRGLRTVLAEAFADPSTVVVDQGRPLLPLAQALKALETVVPSRWLADPSRLAQVSHPLGNGFFEGNHEALTDARADDIARSQLQRAGYLPSA